MILGRFLGQLCFPAAEIVQGVALYDLYADDGDKRGLLLAAAAAEREATHPFAAAIRKAAAVPEAELPPAERLLAIGGSGIAAQIGNDRYFFGSRQGLYRQGIKLPHAVRQADLHGYARLYAARNGRFCGLFLFYPAICARAEPLLRLVRSAGMHCSLTGGDRTVSLLAERLGLQFWTEKGLQEAKKRGKICVVDGKRFSALCRAAAGIERIRVRLHPQSDAPMEDTDMFGKVHYTMKVGGMNCAHCSARVKTALESLRGVSADVSLEEKTVRIKCPALLDPEKLTAAVTEVGFTVSSVERV